MNSQDAIIIRTIKSPLGLVLDLLFNRAFPLIALPIGLYYSIFKYHSFPIWQLPTKAELGFSFWIVCLILPIGFSLTAYLTWDYFMHNLEITPIALHVVRHAPAEQGAFECEPLEAAMRGR